MAGCVDQVEGIDAADLVGGETRRVGLLRLGKDAAAIELEQVAVFFQAPCQDAVEFTGQGRIDLGCRRGRAVEDSLENNGIGAAGKRLPAGGHFVEHRAKAEQVGAGIERLAPRLLRTHVRRRAQRHTGLGDGSAGAQRLANAEVRHHRRAIVEQDVLGLDVPMHHLVAVGVVQRGRHLAGDPQRLVQWQLPRLLADFLPVAVATGVDWRSVAAGLGIGVWGAGGFALLPLLSIRNVSPPAALRRPFRRGPAPPSLPAGPADPAPDPPHRRAASEARTPA